MAEPSRSSTLPRVPDLPCATCGNLMWRGRTSLPEGQARCHPCRRADWQHGTRKGYRDHACRCGQCRAWNALQFKDYRRERRASGNPVPKRGWIAESLRRQIYERDGWTCQLCGGPLDVVAHPNSDWAPSLDHIVPKSAGGPDSVDNLRASHRWCNTVRGDGRWHSDLFEEAS